MGKEKYSEKLADFICSEVEKGKTVEDVVRDNPKKVPVTAHTIYRWKSSKEDFHKKLMSAYEAFFMVKIDELERLSTLPLEILFPQYFTDERKEDKNSYKLAFEARRARIDVIKFLIAKVAGVLSDKFVPKSEVKQTGAVDHQISVISYARPEVKQIKGDTYEQEKE